MTDERVDRVWNDLILFKSNIENVEDEDRCTIEPRDEEWLRADILIKLDQGWTEREVYRHMKWTEYFDDYTHTEERCLRELSETGNQARNRIKEGR